MAKVSFKMPRKKQSRETFQLVTLVSILVIIAKPSTASQVTLSTPSQSSSRVDIPEGYDRLATPSSNDSTTHVSLSMVLVQARKLDEMNEELTMEVIYRVTWSDPRLEKWTENLTESYRVLSSSLMSKIWHPDVLIDHLILVEQPSLVSTPASLRIYKEGRLRYSAKVNTKTACRMKFHKYPLDTQFCSVNIKSYAYTVDTMDLDWEKNRRVNASGLENLPNFDIRLKSTDKSFFTTGSGSYRVLSFTLAFRRSISNHLMQSYLPSFIFVTVSWLSFLIPKDKVQERVGACLVTLLSLMVMLDSITKVMPPISYLSALHIWMTACTIFVFLALTEFAIVLKLRSSASALLRKMENDRENSLMENKKNKDMEKENIPLVETGSNAPWRKIDNDGGNDVEKKDNDTEKGKFPESATRKGSGPRSKSAFDLCLQCWASSSPPQDQSAKLLKIAQTMEKFAPFFFGLVFILFVVVYWTWLCCVSAVDDADY